MPRWCEAREIEGTRMILCHSGPRPKKSERCVVCGNPRTKLCDYPVGKNKTCDAPLCDEHAYRPYQQEDIDYCPKHKEIILERGLE